jgi:LysM repeat protein
MAAVVPLSSVRLTEPPNLYVVPAPEAPPVAVYRRRRFVAALLAATMLVALVLAVRLAAAALGGVAASAPEAPLSPAPAHVVQPGDTLWSVADALTPPGRDVRITVDRLERTHGSAALQVGQRLALPT